MSELRGKRVLVVEDEPLVSMMIEDELALAGADVFSASTLAAAIELVKNVDLALLDCNIHGESVMSVADLLACREVPFAFVTGYGATCDYGKHATAPVISKPFSPGAMAGVASAMLVPPGHADSAQQSKRTRA